MKFGEKPKDLGIKKLALAVDEIKFIKVLSVEEDFFINTKVHFIKGLGSIHCTTTTDEDGLKIKGDCCTSLDELNAQGYEDLKGYPTSRHVLPIMVFTTTDKNNFGLPQSYCRMDLTDSQYTELLEELEDNDIAPEDVTNIVLRVKGVQEGIGQFARVVPKLKVKGKFKLPESILEPTRNFLNTYKDTIRTTMGKDITGDKLKKALEQVVVKPKENKVDELPQPQQIQPEQPQQFQTQQFQPQQFQTQQFQPQQIQPQQIQPQQIQPQQFQDLSSSLQVEELDLESLDLSEVMGDMDSFYNV